MSVVVAIVVGFLAARLLLVTCREVLANPTLDRENYRGHHLPTAAGLLIVAAVLLVEGLRAFAAALEIGDTEGFGGRSLFLVAVLGFALLGLIDDVLGNGDDRGFTGHLKALTHGRVTTGMLKLAGGGALALVLAVSATGETGVQPFVDAALIALFANLANLLDRAPGRTIKFFGVVYIAIAIVCGTAAAGVALAVVMGAAFGVLPDDLRERLMIGDTGANALGAVLGLALVVETSPTTRAVVAAVLLVLNLASERVSFSRVINGFPPLRSFDRLGRVTEP